MRRVLFLIHDLGHGGAEKVLVNLLNHLDLKFFAVTVIALFGGGVNEKFLRPEIHYSFIYEKMIPANSKWMKLWSPKQLHKKFIKDEYDIEVAYLEGPCARIVSGCQNSNTRLVSWIHVEQHTKKNVALSFRSYQEAQKCYKKFDRVIYVSKYVMKDFQSIFDDEIHGKVLYNTVETDKILALSKEDAEGLVIDGAFNLIAVGTLKKSKGYERLINIIKRLSVDGKKIRLNILGEGNRYELLKETVNKFELTKQVVFLGYHTNPYKYVAKCDLFVCSSFSEGFSTAATEALIVGTPVCTVEVSGMKEMLGENNEYGIVTENNEEALYEGIKMLLDNPDLLAHYKNQAQIRGKEFSTEKTVKAVEEMLLDL